MPSMASVHPFRSQSSTPFFNKGVIEENPNFTIYVNSTRDTDGHGTHTACCAGHVQSQVAMPPMTWAVHCIGGWCSILMGLDGVPLYEDPITITSFSAMERGIVVSSSAGNGCRVFVQFAQHPGSSLFLEKEHLSGLRLLYNDTLKACKSLAVLPPNARPIVVCEENKTTNLVLLIEFLKGTGAAGAVLITNQTSFENTKDMSNRVVLISQEEAKPLLDYVTNEVTRNSVRDGSMSDVEQQQLSPMTLGDAAKSGRRLLLH
ncbi:hypothetical protein AMTR_s00017p00219070 [Amborella trichopoda]|uniref:Peptidase S8/S53 domain-containing protein n=1 Tax=Amborella trichopoda TaxID=13333 RepID=W1PFD8_AMBTC|nr:hypothetical protein AMTR_s00017p00219070 [Amborella trichopoda]